MHSDPTADYRNLGLLQLLKKASRRRGGASLPSTTTAAQHSLSYGQTGQDINSLGRAQSSLHSYAGQCCFFASFKCCPHFVSNPPSCEVLPVEKTMLRHQMQCSEVSSFKPLVKQCLWLCLHSLHTKSGQDTSFSIATAALAACVPDSVLAHVSCKLGVIGIHSASCACQSPLKAGAQAASLT